jgi:hypothetical protein
MPIALIMGEAGTINGDNIITTPLKDMGRASNICNAIFSTEALQIDFQTFNKVRSECFMIDKALFSGDVNGIMVGVWAVPERNKASFEYSNPNIAACLLHKVVYCEPQIWIFARSF